MSRRATVLLSTLATAALVSCVALTGCGGGTPALHAAGHRRAAAPGAAPAVGVLLHRGTSATAKFCGAQHHVRIYGPDARIAVTGRVTPVPSGNWKVKLQVKVCRRGAYADLVKLRAGRQRHADTFTSTLNMLPAGDYAVRAVLYLAGGTRVKSQKRHLVIR